MATDKKISELPVSTGISGADVSILVKDGTDYQFPISQLLDYFSNTLTTGAILTFGTLLPQNTTGKNGDVFFNTTAKQFAQKLSGTWTVVYTLPETNAADGTLLYGAGLPASSTGKNADSYVNTLTGIFYLKTSDSWAQIFSMQTGPQGPKGDKGDTGTTGLNGRTILNGAGNPSNTSIGGDGDFYLNTSTLTLFGPKAGGVWGMGVLIIGEDGAQGETGPPGPAGSAGVQGVSGSPGPQGLPGADGVAGVIGPQGATGPAGLNGLNGIDGLGVPPGGTVGQVLKKSSNVNFVTVWEDAPSGGSAPVPGPIGPPGTPFIIPVDAPAENYIDFITGVSLTTNGQFFGVVNDSGKTLRVYKNTNGDGVYQSTIEWTGLPDYTYKKKAIDYGLIGEMPNKPVIDFDTSELFRSSFKIKNLATGAVPNETFVNASFNFNLDLSSPQPTVQTGFPDSTGGNTGYKVSMAANPTLGGFPATFSINSDAKLSTGNWSLCYDVRLPDGQNDRTVHISDGYFIGNDRTAVLTTNWQTIMRNINVTGAALDVGSYNCILNDTASNPSSALAVYISNIRIIAGSVPFNLPPIQSDIMAPSNKPNISESTDGQIIDLQTLGGNPFKVEFNPSVIFDEFTIAFCMNYTDDNANNVVMSYAGEIILLSGGRLVQSSLMKAISKLKLPLNKWMTVIATADANGSSIYVDGLLADNTETPITSKTLANLELFGASGSGITFFGKLSGLTIWNKKLKSPTVMKVSKTMFKRLRLKNIALTEENTYFNVEGDSISAVSGYPIDVRGAFTPPLPGNVFAVAASKLGQPTDTIENTLYGRLFGVSAILQKQIDQGKNVILSVLIGANDIATITTSEQATDFYVKLVNYYYLIRRIGVKVIACTITDNGNIEDKTFLIQINSLIRSNATKYDQLADFYSSSLLTPATSTYFQDLLHPNDSGQAVMTSIITPCLSALY